MLPKIVQPIGACVCLLIVVACHSTLVPGQILSADEAKDADDAYAHLPEHTWQEPNANNIPSGPAGDQIRYGIRLLTQTQQLIGPHATNPNLRFSANGYNCVNCHQIGASGLPGTKPFALPYVNVAHEYPKFDHKTMRVITLEERVISMCNRGVVTPHADTPEIAAMVAYMEWLGQYGRAQGRVRGTGLPTPSFPNRPANPAVGQALYTMRCLPCHGSQGLGQKRADYEQGGGYTMPPIAGDEAFDDGGHMYMVPMFARFIYGNMPLGTSHEAPALTPGDALDIAAYVDSSLPRKHQPARANFYPNATFRAAGFAIPENFPNDANGLLRAKFGPFSGPND